jgi:superfamily I DNA/RNA helicase
MAWLDNLNTEQRGAIEDTIQNVALIAGPGTGKTRTLLRKALQLIEEEVAQANNVRIVNFTRAGVYDLRRKLVSDSRYLAIDPRSATTFHSLALRTLFEVRSTAIPSPFVVLDDWEERTFVDQLAKHEMGIGDIRRARRLREDYNSRWCVASESADEWLSAGKRRRYEAVYNLARELLGFATRGELTFLWWRYLGANPEAGNTELAFPWTHLLVDEYQDLNECEHEILQRLASAGVHVFAVGDPNQSIYSMMRHAHPELCWEFPQRVSPGDLHVLQQSYRCPASVLRLGQALLNSAEGVPDPTLAQSEGEANILSFPSDSGERSGIARLAQHLLERHPESRVLVAVATKSLGKAFMKELAPLVAVEDRTTKPVEGPEECRLAMSLLRLLKEPQDSVAAATAIILNCASSARADRVAELLQVGQKNGLRIADIFHGKVGLTGRLAVGCARAVKVLDALKNSDRPIDTLREATGCEEVTGDVDGTEERLEEVLTATEQLAPGRVTVMTLHGCKGTEAEWVFIPAAEPGILERDLVGSPKEERRRLLYVGMTRAIDGLFISFSAERRDAQRYRDPLGPSLRKGASVFVDEICDRSGQSPESGTTFLQARLRGCD